MYKKFNIWKCTGKFNITQFVIIMIFLFSFFGSSYGAEVVDRIVAIVNDDIIRLAELNKAFEPVEKEIKAKGYSAEKTREITYEKKMSALNNMIDDKLADQKIKETGITVKESEIDSAIEQVKSNSRYSQEELELALNAGGLTMAEYREEIRKQIQRNKLISMQVTSSIIITQSDVQAYYDAHPESYSVKKKYSLRNIFMASPADDAARKGVYAKMELAYEKLKSGASFTEVAKQYSEAKNAGDGGRLGFFSIDDLADSIQPAVSALHPGEFSPILETEQGFQIFFVDEIADMQGKTLAEASDAIRQKLYEEQVNKKFKSWIDEMRKEAHIQMMY